MNRSAQGDLAVTATKNTKTTGGQVERRHQELLNVHPDRALYIFCLLFLVGLILELTPIGRSRKTPTLRMIFCFLSSLI